MSVKDKPLKKCHSDARITIDVVHKDIIDEFTKQKLSIEKSVEKSNEIEDDINDYYLDNGLILNDYYNNNYTSTKSKPIDTSILNFFNQEKIID
jgi:hypothetical protein